MNSQPKRKERKRKIDVLTCAYCGVIYPKGTPQHGAQILTDHIKACEKHPMRKLEADCAKLRKALAGVIGVETVKELRAMEIAVLAMSGEIECKVSAINAIHALLETAPSSSEP